MKYNSMEAVDYAKKYALTPNKNYKFFDYSSGVGGDCTNFLSQCLHAGSAQMVYTPNPWYYKNISKPPYYTCSMSWSVAHSLYWFLKNNDHIRAPGPKGRETNNPNDINLGDLIFFEDLRHRIFHGTIVTGFTLDGKPLLSQHSSNDLDIPIKPHYYNLKIHYLNIYL